MPTESWLAMTAPIGILLLKARNQRLVGIEILVDAAGVAAPAVALAEAVDPVLLKAKQELEEYFAGSRRGFDVPLDLSGQSPFTRKILEALGSVPCGATLTYGELARRVGNPRAARAVGRVMALNPLPIIIPCHRVVAAGGKPGGYSGGGGLQTKDRLLALERTGRLANQADFQEKTA